MYTAHKWTNVIKLFLGMNVVDTPDVVTKRGQATYILNCYNSPEGGVAKLFGRSKHNSTALGAAAEVTGIYQIPQTTSFFCISEAKFYKDNAGTWDNKTGAVTITDSQDNLWSFSKFQDSLIGTSLSRDAAIEHDGGAGNAAAVSNMPAAKFSSVLANRLFALNTAAQPKLAYWSGLNDRTSWDATNDFLNFKASEADDEAITAVGTHLNNMIVGKDSSIYRAYHTATSPPFKYYVISRKHGMPAPLTVQNIPPAGAFRERLIWMGRDNFYQMDGDEIISIGDDIKNFFSQGGPWQINLNRLAYYTSGIIKEKNLYYCAVTSGSGTTNDYIFILDYKNMHWSVCNFNSNAFGLRIISGREYLYSGTYNGFVCKHDPAIYNNLGVKYKSEMYFPWIDFGDTQLEKQIQYIVGLFDAVGAYDLTLEYRTNLVSDNFTMTPTTGADLLGVDFVLGTSSLGGDELVEVSNEVIKRVKRIQIVLTHNVLDEYFRLFALGMLWKPMKGYRIE